MAGASPVQTQEDLVPPAPAASGYRLAGVLLAPAVAVVVHLVLVGPFGLAVRIPASPGSTQLQDLSLLTTVLFTLGIGLAGWAAMAVLTRTLGPPTGRRLWIVLAVAVWLVSLLPILALDISTGAKWGLVALHTAVALVLIPSLASTRRAQPLDRGQRPRTPDTDPAHTAPHAEAPDGPAPHTAAPPAEDGSALDDPPGSHAPALGDERPSLTPEPGH